MAVPGFCGVRRSAFSSESINHPAELHIHLGKPPPGWRILHPPAAKNYFSVQLLRKTNFHRRGKPTRRIRLRIGGTGGRFCPRCVIIWPVGGTEARFCPRRVIFWPVGGTGGPFCPRRVIFWPFGGTEARFCPRRAIFWPVGGTGGRFCPRCVIFWPVGGTEARFCPRCFRAFLPLLLEDAKIVADYDNSLLFICRQFKYFWRKKRKT